MACVKHNPPTSNTASNALDEPRLIMMMDAVVRTNVQKLEDPCLHEPVPSCPISKNCIGTVTSLFTKKLGGDANLLVNEVFGGKIIIIISHDLTLAYRSRLGRKSWLL